MADFGVNDTIVAFGGDDEILPIGNPAQANQILNDGLLFGATPQQSDAIDGVLSPQDMEFNTAKVYYDQKFGTNHTPEMVEAQIRYEYGDDATPQVANAMNMKAAKHQERRLGEIPADIAEYFGRRLMVRGAIVPKMTEEKKVARRRLAEKVGLPTGFGDFIGPMKRAIMPGPLSILEKTAETITGLLPDETIEKSADFAFGQSKKANEIIAPYMSGVPIEESIANGDLLTAGSDVMTAIAFESPNLAVQLGLARINPMLSMTYMGAGAAAEKRAELGDTEDAIRNTIQPYISGLIEIGTEKYIGTGRVIDRIAQGEIVQGAAKRAATIGLDFLGGAASEGGATLGGNILDMAFGEDVGLFDDVLLSAFVGGPMDMAVGAFSLGDANRIRKQNTNEQIDEIVEQANIPDEQKPLMEEMLKNPTEANTEAYNAFEAEEAPATEGAVVVEEVTPRPEVDEEVRVEEEKIDVADLERAMSADKTQEQKQEAVEDILSETVGISKNWDKVESALPFDEIVLQPERVRQTETIKSAFDKGLHTKTDQIVQRVKKKKAITHQEVGALLIRKTEIVQTIEQIKKEMAQAAKDGNDDLLTVLGQELNEQIEFGVEITETARRGATEVARSLAAMAMQMDKKTFDLVNVISLAQATKGEKLTQEESDSIKEKVDELEAVEADIEKAEAGELDEREAIIDEVERAHRRLKKPGRKKVDKNADVKLIRERQDQIFALIDEINRRKPVDKKIKKVEQPDSEGYLEMINNLKSELELIRAREKAFDKNVRLIDKRDAIISEIENMHRDLKNEADKLEESKLQKDIDRYSEAKRDQDMIAKLLDELRGKIVEKETVTKEDVYGYKQTIAELRKQISDKKIAEKLEGEISELESAVVRADLDFKPTKKEVERRKSERVESLKEKKSEAQKKLRDMKADRDRMDAEESKTIELIEELENAHRKIKNKRQDKKDPNADIKLAIKRQDRIFSVIDEINRGKPSDEKVKKIQEPDSEGYLEMLTNLREELAEVRKERRLDEQIAQMEADIEAGDIAKYEKERIDVEESREIMLKRARKVALQKEINRQIADLKPKTIGDVAADVWDVFRNLKLTADAGHLLRQGGVVMSNPKMWKTGDAQQFFRESMKAMVKDNADLLDATIMSDPDYADAKLAGVAFVEEGQQLDAREEILMNGLLGKAPFGIGKAQQAFGRMQISGTNFLRLLAWKSYKAGNPDMTLDEAKDVAYAVNVLTGRGATVRDPRVSKVLNKIFTSPSFTMSRIQTPLLLAHKRDGKFLWENKPLRKRIIEDSAWFVGSRLALMGLIAAALPDAEIGDDPEHWTYGRLIVDVGSGKTRVYNPWAGIQSLWGALYRGVAGEKSMPETISNMAEGRLHPGARLAEDFRRGESLYEDDISRGEMIVKSLLPISVEGVREAIAEDTGVLDLIAAVSTDVVGIGSVLVDSSDLKESRRGK